MTLNCHLTKEKIESAVLRVSDEIERSKKRENTWKKCSDEQLWFELVSCILGSKIKYETARECTKHLQNEGLLTISELVKNPQIVGMYLADELNKPFYPPFSNGKGRKYPYSKSKSQYIVRTCLEIYKNNSTNIKQILKKSRDGNIAREMLIKFCMGIGPKQASLFLRNIGYCENLAILDSHVIYYMDILGLRNQKKRINTMSEYFMHEKILLSYSNSLNKKMATLDVAIWVVMRVVQREFLR